MGTSAYHTISMAPLEGSPNHRVTNRSRAAEQRWRGIFSQWRKSGLNAHAFCEREKLSEGVFYHWKRRLYVRDGGGKGRRSTHGKFVPLSLCRVDVGQAPLELVFTNGRRLKIAADVDAALLAKVIAIAEPTA